MTSRLERKVIEPAEHPSQATFSGRVNEMLAYLGDDLRGLACGTQGGAFTIHVCFRMSSVKHDPPAPTQTHKGGGGSYCSKGDLHAWPLKPKPTTLPGEGEMESKTQVC